MYKFPTVYTVKILFVLENLWMLEPFLDILERFQSSLALLNIKYDCTVLFLSELHWLFIYPSKYIFSETTIVRFSPPRPPAQWPSGGGVCLGCVSCDLSHHAFDVTCILSQHQLSVNISATAYIVWPRCMLGYTPQTEWQTDVKTLPRRNFVCGR